MKNSSAAAAQIIADASAAALSAARKIPGGKLLRVRLILKGTRIQAAQVSGDFFLVPDDALPRIEQFLLGWDLTMPEQADQLSRRLDKFLLRDRITVSGFSALDLAMLIDEIREQQGITQRAGNPRTSASPSQDGAGDHA